MRVMVTGSRRLVNDAPVREAFARLGLCELIHGGCGGADLAAARVARELGWRVTAYPARWAECGPECEPEHQEWTWRGTSYCPTAGSRRNQEMLDTRPDLVLAFPMPGSRGTLDAVRRARGAGIEVEVVECRSATRGLLT